MEGEELEEHMLRFIDKEYDVLVCTNIGKRTGHSQCQYHHHQQRPFSV